jgi:putative transposase
VDCRTSTIPCTIKPSWSPVAGVSVWERRKINFSQVFAGQAVGIKEVHDDIWLVSFMDYDLGYFDLETQVLEPLENPFGQKVLPMS